ncbi:hypothetical protein LIER_02218 [Lithospermum erythrorhizon]|uniref:Uncharacterized protein n=1 Tax=Lithospermum erythrorhizon TaxID=34254 RepID=A0AAV3NNL5_LITER
MSSSSHFVKNFKGQLYLRTLLKSRNLLFGSNLDNVSSPSKRLISTYFSDNNTSLRGFYSSNMQKNNQIVPHHMYFPVRKIVANGDSDAGKGNNNVSPPQPTRNWKRWVLGILISVIIPSYTHKLGPLGVWKDEFDSRLQEVEEAIEGGEKVATAVEKVAEKWLDSLPEGWLKDTLTIMEQGAERASKLFNKVDNVIDEFQEEEKKIVENWVESAEDRTKVQEEVLKK